MNQSKDKKMTKKVVLQATAILILLAFILVIAGYFYLSFFCGYKFNDLVADIVGNLIGVLSAFLLFDILYNKLTQDAYSKEISQQITNTLMGDSAAIDAFSKEDKINFLISTVNSIVKDKDTVEMITGNITKYFDYTRLNRIRTSFNYTITVTTEFPKAYDIFPGILEEKYFYVQENLNYDVKYVSGNDHNLSSREVKIGFSFDKLSLDAGLLESGKDDEFSKCVFNESLDITKEAIEYLRGLSDTELKNTFVDLFTPVLKIDKAQGGLDRVEVRDGGIVATYKIDYDFSANEHTVRVIFHMPKLWDSILEVTLIDPTKEPKITLDYMPGKMDVIMYSFLNNGDEANSGAFEQQNGLYDISIEDEWIYPKSGIIFFIGKKVKL